MDSIILMGIKHCGKSTQGKRLASQLSLDFYDTDDLITFRNEGKSPRKIYLEGGEEAFKKAEAEACIWLSEKISAENKRVVIASGGGICKNQQALNALHKIGKFIFLQAEEKTTADRIIREVRIDENGEPSCLPAYIAKKNPHSILEVRAIFHDFYSERVRLYSAIADFTVKMENSSKAENTKKILDCIQENF